MTEAFLLLLAALTASSPASEDRASGATSAQSDHAQHAAHEDETTQERIARIKARLGVRSVRVSNVRCKPSLCSERRNVRAASMNKSDRGAAVDAQGG